ncbi:hypothetical protein [uncultured Deinococcus sp.]|uniref:SDH family Clp fold serine proteinase n=1 Tax=uncultured Deinococcus sp. TaxID=158789 RepID=UPI00258DB3A2|nr:hypothetical protein [uncultured Deinococcus sp.]
MDITSNKILQYALNQNSDVYVYSGAMSRPGSNSILEAYYNSSQRENAALVLTTYGGDAEAAYIIARFFRQMYTRFTVYVVGPCKSAGTLLALGAHEIVMDLQAELGPLDVQVAKDNELWRRNSGLDIFQSLTTAGQYSFQIFETNFLRIKASSGGVINTETAADVASKIAVGLLAPITSQIDPLRLGEMQRAVGVAREYGSRLGVDDEIVEKLITDYPSHGFVIDFEEAKDLLKGVRRPTEFEQEFVQQVQQVMKHSTGHECIKMPFPGNQSVAGLIPTEPPAEVEASDAEESEASEAPDVEPAELAEGADPTTEDTHLREDGTTHEQAETTSDHPEAQQHPEHQPGDRAPSGESDSASDERG